MALQQAGFPVPVHCVDLGKVDYTSSCQHILLPKHPTAHTLPSGHTLPTHCPAYMPSSLCIILDTLCLAHKPSGYTTSWTYCIAATHFLLAYLAAHILSCPDTVPPIHCPECILSCVHTLLPTQCPAHTLCCRYVLFCVFTLLPRSTQLPCPLTLSGHTCTSPHTPSCQHTPRA